MSKISSNVPAAVRKQVADANRQAAEQKALRQNGGQPPAPPTAPPTVQIQPVTQFVPGQEPAAPAPDAPVQLPVAASAPPANATDPAVAPAPEPDWKQRYKVVDGKYRSETAQLRAQLEFLQSQNNQLLARSQIPAVAPPAAPVQLAGITPEEVQEYGPELLDVMRRVAAQTVQPGLQRVETAAAEAAQRADVAAAHARQQARLAVYESLTAFNKDWEEINNSDEFLAWLGVVDVISGLTRKQGLLNAFENNDAARVVGIFKAFLEEDSRSRSTARAPTVDPATLIAPGQPAGGAPAAPANQGGRIWSEEEIRAFNVRVRKGRVSDDERQQVETEIMAAAREGRIRPTINTSNLANAAG